VIEKMAHHIPYAQARLKLAELLDQITQDREIVIIQRRGKADVALIPADELASLFETAFLLRSPDNAGRLLEVLDRALKEDRPLALDEFRQEEGTEFKNT
jgi:antitoxin YefM